MEDSEFLKAGETLQTVNPATLRQRRKRAKDAAQKEASAANAAENYDNSVEIDEERIREVLEENGIKHERVLTVLVELVQVAARNLRLTLNEYFVSHGVQVTLAARVAKENLPKPNIEQQYYPGSRIRRHEEYALWDFGMSWRETKGEKYTFEKFLDFRRAAMVDVFRFGKDVLGMDLHDSPHGKWARELYVTKNPDLLPEEYDWEDVKKALAGQSGVHQRLLISSRSSYKSSYNLIDMLSWVLVFGGDIRIFMVSSTRPLSAGFLKKFRSYWTVKNPNEPNLFNQIYPEFMVHQEVDDAGSSKSFVSPMRRLDLIQPTLNSASLDTEGLAGERCDLLVFEDVAEINNSSTEDQREKTLEKVDMLRELLEPFGYFQAVGTPISSGEGNGDGDLYMTLLEREKANPGRLLYQIHPCWTVKPGVRKLPYDPTLTVDEVELLFPERLTFTLMMAKLREHLVTDKNAKVFRQQSLCLWVPQDEDDIKVHFDPDLLTRSVIGAGAIPQGEVVLSCDTAYSLSARADLTSIAALRFYMAPGGLKSVAVVNVEAERFRGSEFAHRLVMLTRQYGAKMVLVEKGPSNSALETQVKLIAGKYGVSVPLYFVGGPAWNTKNAKFERIRELEFLLAQGRLKFITGGYVDRLFLELEKIDGKQSGSNKKDDMADAIALAVKFYKITSAGVELSTEDQQELNRLKQEANRKANHAAIFGTGTPYTAPPPMPTVVPSGTGSKWTAYQQGRSAALKARYGR